MSYLYNILRGKILINHIRHSSNKQIPTEMSHHHFMHFRTQALSLPPCFAHWCDCLLAHTVSEQELLEIELEHLLSDNAAYGNGSSWTERHSKQTATGYIPKTSLLTKELQHSKELWILLNLINEHQRVRSTAQPATGNCTQCEIELVRSAYIAKHSLAFGILRKINLNKIPK